MKLIERDGYYYISYYDKKSKRSRRIATGIKTGKDQRRFAMAKLKEFERQQSGAFYNSIPLKSALLFSEAFSKYLSLKMDLSATTKELKELASDKFIEICGDRFISHYALEDFEMFRNGLFKMTNKKGEPLSVNTVNIRTKDIHSIFEFFVEHEWIMKNYAVVQRAKYQRPRAIPAADWQAILDEAGVHAPKVRRILEFMRWTGLRSGEAVGLTWDKVLLEHNPPVLILYNKVLRDEEYCLLLPEAVKILKEAKKYSAQYAHGSVFGYKSRRFMTFARVQVRLWGETRYNIHQIRKTYITYLFELGLDISDVRSFSRHSSKSMEILVDHYRDIKDRAVVDKAIKKSAESKVKPKLPKLKKSV